MTRIAVDARPLSFPTTGIGRYTRAVLSRLFEGDWEWYLYSDRPLLWPEVLPENVQVRYPRTMLPGMGSIFAQAAYPLWAKKDGIDLFWSPRHHLPLMLGGSTRSIVTVHDLVWQYFPQTMTRMGRLLDQFLMPLSVKASDAVIAVSQATANEVRANWPDSNVSTILEAPFLNLSARSPRGDYFLFVGTLEPRKNLLALLQAFRLYLDTSSTQLPLKIAGGKGWGLPALEERLTEMGLGEHVEILGYASDSELETLYRHARALLMPSLYEGFGLPIVEAFSQATPVLTSNRGAMKEVAGNAALLVDPEDVSGMAEAMRQLTEDHTMVEELQDRAGSRGRVFSWDKAAQETRQLMELLLRT